MLFIIGHREMIIEFLDEHFVLAGEEKYRRDFLHGSEPVLEKC
jgi:hypothetical protein